MSTEGQQARPWVTTGLLSVIALVAILAGACGGSGNGHARPTGADQMALNRARSTCREFASFVTKNHAGTSTVSDVTSLQEALLIAESHAAEPVRSAAAALAVHPGDQSRGKAETQRRADALKAACASVQVQIP